MIRERSEREGGVAEAFVLSDEVEWKHRGGRKGVTRTYLKGENPDRRDP